MNTTQLKDLFRSAVVDTEVPYLWSDDEVFIYMDDAYKSFVRFTKGISDITSTATQVELLADEPYSDLHPSLLAVRKAWLVADGREITIINAQDILSGVGGADYGVALPRSLLDTTSGEVRQMVIGLERDKARWVNVPAADGQVQLLVYRLPLDTLTGEDQELSEVQDIHHLHLLLWMKYLAYQKQDAETFDRNKSKENEARFRNYCAEAKAEWEQYKAKVRVVAYGGL